MGTSAYACILLFIQEVMTTKLCLPLYRYQFHHKDADTWFCTWLGFWQEDEGVKFGYCCTNSYLWCNICKKKKKSPTLYFV